ncbi:MAG: hypothetical protein U9R36_00265 [Elusimicrobiota bacterium]|nr:hypothetical protein [Elusimicrobiota bacterium]
MRKRYILPAFILIGAAAYIISRHYPQKERRFIKALIADGARAVETEDIKTIEKLFARNSPEKEKRMKEAKNYFNEYEPMEIEIQNAKYEIKEEKAIAALFLIITAKFDQLGKVKGRQTVGLKLVKEEENTYRGWRINKIKYD